MYPVKQIHIIDTNTYYLNNYFEVDFEISINLNLN